MPGAAHMGSMLEELLDKFATDDSDISLTLGTSMSRPDRVIQPVGAEATRRDEVGKETRAAYVRGHLNNIMVYDRERVLDYMDAESGDLEPLASAVYGLAEESWSSHILTIESVEAYGDEKGTGLALVLLGAAIEALSAGRKITVVLEPCPLDTKQLTASELKAGQKKLRDHWAKLGFQRVSSRSKYMSLVASDYEMPDSVLNAN